MNLRATSILTFLFIIAICGSCIAQRFENVYRGSSAAVLQITDTSRSKTMLKGATILWQNGSNQVNVNLTIPNNIFNTKTNASQNIDESSYLFKLTIPINPSEIQDVLTSEKTFTTFAVLSINSITQKVKVSYLPFASGTEENGNFNLFMTVSFQASDFGLVPPTERKEIILTINNGKVNRI